MKYVISDLSELISQNLALLPLNISVETLNKKDWLLAQCHRDDSVGQLARLWVEENDKSQTLDAWLLNRRNGVILRDTVDQVTTEYSQAAEDLKHGRISATFPKHLLRIKNGSSNWAFHKATPEISVTDYLTFRQSKFAESVRAKKIIYLDINHWIHLRKFILKDKGAQEIYGKLHEVLKEASLSGEIVCPISWTHMEELMKQTDPITRLATAELMDDLSGGVCLVHSQEIYRIEVNLLIGRQLFPTRSFACENQIWTNPSWMLGEMIPEPKGWDSDTNRMITKVAIDLAWESRMVDLVESISQKEFPKRDYPTQAEALKTDALFYKTNPEPFAKILEKEKALLFHSTGILEIITEIAKVFFEKFPKECHELTQKEPSKAFDPGNLASMQILAGINAKFVMNPDRINANDLLDAAHAALAIPYCDIFVCDSPMAHRLKAGPLAFDKLYETEIYGSAQELLANFPSPSDKVSNPKTRQ